MTREWFIDTPAERVRLATPAEPMPRLFVRAALDRWLQDPSALRSLVAMAESIAPERHHLTHVDDFEGIKRLRETLLAAFARGTLVVETVESPDAALVRAPKTAGSSAKSASALGAKTIGAKGDAAGAGADVPSDVPSTSTSPEPLGWFDVTVVDAWGEPIGDLALELAYAGTRKKLTTPANGRVRLDGVSASFGSARILDVPAARSALTPRFAKKPPSSPPVVENPTQVALTDDLDTVALTSETPKTIVVVKPLTRVRLVGMHFDTNKSFMRPTAVHGIRLVVAELEKSPKGNVLIVGHTDTRGGDDENLGLSVDRAEAVQAYLRNDVKAWEAWFSEAKIAKTRWGDLEIAQMISALPSEPSVAGFQQWSNANRGTTLKVDGKAGPLTRHELIAAYMELGGTTLPKGIGLAVHGCGEFFPVDDLGNDVEDENNRRVEMYCFDAAIEPPVPGTRAKRGEKEYPAWRDQVTKNVDVEADVQFEFATLTQEGAQTRLLLLDGLDAITLAFDETQADRDGNLLTFRLNPEKLPRPTRLVLEQWGIAFPQGVRFSPDELALALRARDGERAAGIVYGRAPKDGAGANAALGASASVKGGAKDKKAPETDLIRVLIDDDDGTIDLSDLILAPSTCVARLRGSTPFARKAGDPLIGEFPIDIPTQKTYLLDIDIISNRSGPGPESMVEIRQDITFASLSDGTFAPLTTSLHPRLRLLRVDRFGGGRTAKAIWTFMLDVSFIDISRHLIGSGTLYDDLRKHVDSVTPIKTAALLDPRRPTADPRVYTVASRGTLAEQPSAVDVLVYFQNESPKEPADPERKEFGSEDRTLTGSADGKFGVNTPGGHTEYPFCGWAHQLDLSGKKGMLIIFPSVVADGGGVNFGSLGFPVTGGPRIMKLLFCVWADTKKRGPLPMQIDRFIIAGWSSGMNTVAQWIEKDDKDPGHVADVAFCFDAPGVTEKTVKPGNGAAKVFPVPSMWEVWLGRKKNRRVALLAGRYMEVSYRDLGEYLRTHKLGARVMMNEPSAPATGLPDLTYWYVNPDYKAAHFNRDFDPIPTLPAAPSATETYFKSESGSPTFAEYSMSVCHGSDTATGLPIKGLARHEAAHFMRNTKPVKGASPSSNDGLLPASSTADDLRRAVRHLLHPELDIVSPNGELERAGKLRHTWSMSGGKTTSVGGVTGYHGYFELLLRAL